MSEVYRTSNEPSLQLKGRKLVGIRSWLSAYNCLQASLTCRSLEYLTATFRADLDMGCPFACEVTTGHHWLQHSILFLGKLCSVTVSVHAGNIVLCNVHLIVASHIVTSCQLHVSGAVHFLCILWHSEANTSSCVAHQLPPFLLSVDPNVV